MTWKPVTLGSVKLWYDPEELYKCGDTVLAPEHHIEDGRLVYASGSYAHIFGSVIQRYGVVVANLSDLKEGHND